MRGFGGRHVGNEDSMSRHSLIIGADGGVIFYTLANKFEFRFGAAAGYNRTLKCFLLLLARFLKAGPPCF